jgi:hypothetical protein
MNKERKIFFELKPRCALLLSVVGAYNKGYTVQPSARASPKFFFRYATEKLRISLTLGDIFLKKFEFKDFCCWALKKKEFLIFLI